MSQENPQNIFQEIISCSRRAMPALVNPSENADISREISQFSTSLEQLFPPGHPRDCLRAALWLLADNLHESHTICQNIPTIYGSAWHALLHRREADFSNSKYWWRRAAGIRWHTLPAQLRS